MLIRSFEELVAGAKALSKKARIALCCAQDAHALEAVVQARRENLAESILIGDRDVIKSRLKDMEENSGDYEIIPCNDAAESINLAAALVRTNSADVIMKGKMQTAELLHGVLKKENGLRSGRILSVCGNFELRGQIKDARHRLLTITDPALSISPDLAMKESLLENALILRRALGDVKPKAAVIAANEIVNPKSQASLDAAAIKQFAQENKYGACSVEGPISLDLAINPEAVQLKEYRNEVAGDADILLMPDVISANVLAKAMTDVAGVLTAGIVMGARVPIILVSRAAAMSDKFHSIALAVYVSQAL